MEDTLFATSRTIISIIGRTMAERWFPGLEECLLQRPGLSPLGFDNHKEQHSERTIVSLGLSELVTRMSTSTEKEKMLRGELYHAFTPDLTAARERCKHACNRFNNAGEVPRRRLIELWKDITEDRTPLPPPGKSPAEDEVLLENEPWIEGPIRIDYGFNVKIGAGVFINFNCVIIDTCLVTIGARTLMGPNVSLYSGTHPLDPALRNGTRGPEAGKEIHIGEDCWFGGDVVVLPGVTIGKGVTIGAGSVVTKDVPAFHVAAGNPARVIRKIETSMTE